MSELEKCIVCKNDIEVGIKECPHCEIDKQKESRWAKWVRIYIVITIVFIVLGTILGVFSTPATLE